MELSVITSDKQNMSAVQLSDDVFAQRFNEALIHQVVIGCMANLRASSCRHKTRSDVRGGGKKPWKQKGTGRARAGSIRSPIWRGGGKTFAGQLTHYKQKINKKMYVAAVRSILSELYRQGRFSLIQVQDLELPKTKLLLQMLSGLGISADKRVLLVVKELSTNLLLAARNVPYVTVLHVDEVDPISLVSAEHVYINVDAVQQLEEKWS